MCNRSQEGAVDEVGARVGRRDPAGAPVAVGLVPVLAVDKDGAVDVHEARRAHAHAVDALAEAAAEVGLSAVARAVDQEA